MNNPNLSLFQNFFSITVPVHFTLLNNVGQGVSLLQFCCVGSEIVLIPDRVSPAGIQHSEHQGFFFQNHILRGFGGFRKTQYRNLAKKALRICHSIMVFKLNSVFAAEVLKF